MNGIGRDFLKAKPLCGFLAIDLHKQINGGLSVPFFSWIGIDVVHHFPDLFFCIALFRLIFRDYIPNQFMVAFTVAFLVAVHGIAVKYPALNLSGHPQLTAQVDIPGIQQACIDIGVDGAVRDWQFIPVAFANDWKGLSLFQQG